MTEQQPPVTWVVTAIELDATTARYSRPTLRAIPVWRKKPPPFPAATGTYAFYVPLDLMEAVGQLEVYDEIRIEQRPAPGMVIESMTGVSLVKKGQVDWRQWDKLPQRKADDEQQSPAGRRSIDQADWAGEAQGSSEPQPPDGKERAAAESVRVLDATKAISPSGVTMCGACGALLDPDYEHGPFTCPHCGMATCPFCGQETPAFCEHMLAYYAPDADGGWYDARPFSEDETMPTLAVGFGEVEWSAADLAQTFSEMGGDVQNIINAYAEGFSEPPYEPPLFQLALANVTQPVYVVQWEQWWGTGAALYFVQDVEAARHEVDQWVVKLRAAFATLEQRGNEQRAPG